MSIKAFYQLLCVLLLLSHAVAAEVITQLSQDMQYQDAKISPNGRFLSVVVNVEGKRAIGIIELDTFTMVHGIRLPGQLQVGEYFWANNERLVIKLAESVLWAKEPAYYGELFAINWDGSDGKMIYGYRAGNMRPGSSINQGESTRGWADIVHLLPGNQKQILISSTPWSQGAGERWADLMLLDIYSGRTRKIVTAPISYASFITDQHGELKFAIGTDVEAQKRLFRFDTTKNSWAEIAKLSFGSKFWPAGFNESGDGLYVLDNYQQDKKGLFQLNLQDFSYTPIYTDPNVDVTSYAYTKDGNRVFALRLDDGLPRYVMLSGQSVEAQIFKGLLESFPGSAVVITSTTTEGNYWIVKTYSDVDPGTFYIYERGKKQLSRLFDAMPALANASYVATQAVAFSSFDDTTIHGYLTKGNGDTAKPLVVLVHGGPHGVRDYWGFDPEVQVLAQAGYAVLQINYRGSTGYGSAHEVAGHLEWGNAIQRDIIAGAEWAIKAGHTQAGNLCIMGTSFGGYSALQSATLAPDLFKCAIAVSGVYDLTIMKSDGDIPRFAYGVAYLEQVLGSNEAVLKQYSPVYQANKIKSSVLLAHGKRDKRAPLEHALRMRKALDSAGVSYQWLQFDDETHGFYAPVNRELYYRSVLAFLEKNLQR